MRAPRLLFAATLLLIAGSSSRPAMAAEPAPLLSPITNAVLQPAAFAHHIERFNAMAPETVVNVVPDAKAWEWMQANIPLFSCPDTGVEEIYYFRWWSLRKHLVRTATGFAFTEFLQKNDPISSAVGHHVMEGRWLHDPRYIDDYARYWLHGGPDGTLHPKLHNYSEWLPDALFQRYLANGDARFVTGELDALIRDYEQWEREKQLPSGLFWQFDVRDAMEESISGSRTARNIRPPLNSYMYGNARAIAAIARIAGRTDVADRFEAKAERLRSLIETTLWDPTARFFKVKLEHDGLADAREEIGFIPWYFELPEPGRGYEAAWSQFTDASGFHAPYGLTTAERRHPKFRSHGIGTCEWDGAVWPYATSQTLTALANVVRDYPGAPVSTRDWFEAFLTYTRSQHDADGRPYIGEYLDEKTGDWIKVKKPERSRYYNHSTYADLIIAGLAGVRPEPDASVVLEPLLPANAWDWFCVDGIPYHGHSLTVVWDRDGSHFQRGAGFTVLLDGRIIAQEATLTRTRAALPR